MHWQIQYDRIKYFLQVFAYFLPCLFSRFLGLNVTIAMKHFSSGSGLHAANSSQPTYQSSQQTTGRVTRSIKKRNVASPPPSSTLMWLPILNLGQWRQRYTSTRRRRWQPAIPSRVIFICQATVYMYLPTDQPSTPPPYNESLVLPSSTSIDSDCTMTLADTGIVKRSFAIATTSNDNCVHCSCPYSVFVHLSIEQNMC